MKLCLDTNNGPVHIPIWRAICRPESYDIRGKLPQLRLHFNTADSQDLRPQRRPALRTVAEDRHRRRIGTHGLDAGALLRHPTLRAEYHRPWLRGEERREVHGEPPLVVLREDVEDRVDEGRGEPAAERRQGRQRAHAVRRRGAGNRIAGRRREVCGVEHVTREELGRERRRRRHA